MSSALQDELSSLTNDQLRSRLMQHGLGNMPVTSTTRQVLLSKLRKTIEGQKSAQRRETMHATKHPADEVEKPGPASRKANRRNTINATPISSEDIVQIAKPTNMRRSGRTTPTTTENGNAAPIAVPPSENNIIELDEDNSVQETYVRPKRTSRSPSLGKSQTVVTSYKTEVAKPIPIVESNEEDDEEEEEEKEDENRIYPSLTFSSNGFKGLSSTKKQPLQSTLGRTTTHTIAYEPATAYKPLYERNYHTDVSFKTPLSKPIVPTYTPPASNLNRRYTTSSYSSSQSYPDDDSATEHSDIDAPYLSNFAKRLSQLRPEPLDRKIIADVKQHHRHEGDNALWQSFSNLVTTFGRKFGTILLAGSLLLIVVFIYVFFIMA